MKQYPPKNRYTASAFHKKERYFGEIIVRPNSLIFESEKADISLPLRRLNLKAGGANDKMLFFTHTSEPDWTVCTSDHQLLNHPKLNATESLRQQIADIQKAKRQSIHFLLLLVLLVVGGICGLFKLKEPMVTAIADSIPPSWEEKLGDSAFSQFKTGSRLIDDPQAAAMLKKITDPLLMHIPQERYPFKVHIADDKAVNAFALPGGIIVINSGLILEAGSPEEIAGVLAHEAAHVTLQHSMRQMISSAGIFVLVQAFFGDASGIIAVMAENSAFLLTRKYSRDYERQADETGWHYLAEAGIDPRGMSAFFERLLKKQEETKDGNALTVLDDSLNFLSTHPASRERIEHLEEIRKTSDYTANFTPLDLKLTDFQKALQQAGGDD